MIEYMDKELKNDNHMGIYILRHICPLKEDISED